VAIFDTMFPQFALQEGNYSNGECVDLILKLSIIAKFQNEFLLGKIYCLSSQLLEFFFFLMNLMNQAR
jgi:hypothetical protein